MDYHRKLEYGKTLPGYLDSFLASYVLVDTTQMSIKRQHYEHTAGDLRLPQPLKVSRLSLLSNI